jgi:RimK family alpha-L-glutamate ligase
MYLAVLAARDSWYLADLRRAAADRHEITPIGFRELQSAIAISAGSAVEPRVAGSQRPAGEITVAAKAIDLKSFDAVIVRSMPPGSLEQIVFRMDLLARLEASGPSVFNPPRAIEAAVDKYLASARLAAAGLPVPPTIVCQSPEDAIQAFFTLGGRVVVKPLFGSEGRGIALLDDEALAERAFRMLANMGAVLYLQQFIPHDGFDIRALVVGQKVFAMRRKNPNDWRTNVSRGATAEAIELDPELASLARRAAEAIAAPIAGVDLLPGRDGNLYVLEVNAVPGWKALAAAIQTDIAAAVLEYVEESVHERRSEFTVRPLG